MGNYLQIALLICSVALITSVVLQHKGVGLGGLLGVDTGQVFTTRRGIEKTLFWITVGLSVVFVALIFATILIQR
jgi:preprotein translocase subunit SecG